MAPLDYALLKASSAAARTNAAARRVKVDIDGVLALSAARNAAQQSFDAAKSAQRRAERHEAAAFALTGCWGLMGPFG